ncbi:MAG: endonuclease III [Myxococcales bacterium]|nr:endonuclease III [Myxococcales bacterium]
MPGSKTPPGAAKRRPLAPVNKPVPLTKATRKPIKGKWPPDRKRVAAVVAGLDALYGNATCELDHKNAFELLCATILSAQCTDERVNKVTPLLFATFPTPEAMAEAPAPVLEELIKSTGFYRQKAKSLLGTARLIVDRFGGEVPRQLEELRSLPGVARKTANVVLGTAFGLAVGVVVDTHVQRLALRLGLTRNTTPEKIEHDLMGLIPQDHWIQIAHQLIWHGRRLCFARKPQCNSCLLAPHCPSAFSEG